MKKEYLGGAIAGVIATLVIMFSTGWAVTSGSANATTADEVESAVINNLTPICVAQFKESTDKDTQFKALKALDEWKRADFVDKQGWATMPGSDSPARFVARECVRRILSS